MLSQHRWPKAVASDKAGSICEWQLQPSRCDLLVGFLSLGAGEIEFQQEREWIGVSRHSVRGANGNIGLAVGVGGPARHLAPALRRTMRVKESNCLTFNRRPSVEGMALPRQQQRVEGRSESRQLRHC